MSNNIGLKIKVDIDKKALKKSLQALDKGIEVEIKFNDKSFDKMMKKIKELNNLELKAFSNSDELKNLSLITEQLNRQISLLEKMAKLNNKPTKTEDNSELKELKSLQDELYALKTKQLTATEEEFDIYSKYINKIQEEVTKKSQSLNDEREKLALKEREEKLQDKLNFQTDIELNKAEQLVSLEKQKLNTKLKDFESSKNFEYADTEKLEAIKKSIQDLDGLSTKQVQQEVKRINAEIKDLTSEAKTKRINETGKSLGSLGDSFKKLTQFASLTMVFNQLWNELRKGVEHIREVDGAFTNMSMTMTSLTEEGFDGMLEKVNELSKSMGAVSSDVLKIAQTFANDSTTLQAVMDKLAPSVALMNISGMNPTEVTKSVMSIANSYQLLAEDGSNAAEVTEYLGDVISKVSANMDMDFVEGVEGLVSGIGVAGSTMRAAGVDMEWFVGQLGNAMVATGQTSEKLGRGMRTITARVMQQKQALEEMGESTEDIEVIFANGEKALNSLGIMIRNDLTGDLKSFSSIMDELGGKWESLSDSTKYYLAETLAGKNQMDIFIGMMDSYDTATKLVESAYNSQGTLMSMNEVYAESLQGKFNSLTSSLQELYRTVLNTDGFKALLDGVTSLINGVTKLVETFGALPVVTAPVLTTFLNFNKSGKELNKSIISMIPLFSGLTTAMEGAGLKALALKSVMGLGLPMAITGVIALFGLLMKETKSVSESIDETIDSMDKLSGEVKTFNSIEDNLDKYERLNKELMSVKEGSEKSQEILSEIESIRRSLISEDASMEDILNNEYLALDKQLSVLRLINKERLQEAVEKFEGEYKQKDIDNLNVLMEQELSRWTAWKEALEEAKTTGSDSVIINGTSYSVEVLNNNLEETTKNLQTQYGQWLKINSKLQYFQESGVETELTIKDIGDETRTLLDTILNCTDTMELLNKKTVVQAQATRKTKEELKELSKNYVETTKELEEARELLDSVNEDGLNIDNADEFLSMFEDFTGNITDATEVQEYLNDKIREMEQAQNEAYQNMLREDEEFWNSKIKNSEEWKNYVNQTNESVRSFGADILGEESQDFVDFINGKYEQRKIDLENAESMAHAERILSAGLVNDLGEYFSGLVDDKGNFRSVDYANIVEFLNTQGTAEAQTVQELKELWNKYYTAKAKALDTELRELEDKLDVVYEGDRENIYGDMGALNKLNNQMQNLFNNMDTSFGGISNKLNQNTTGGLKKPSSSSSSSSSTKKEVEDLDLVIDRYYELENAMKRVDNALSLNKTKRETASASEKVKLMEQEVKLLKEKQALTEKYRKELNKEANELKKTLQSNGFKFDSDNQITNYKKRLEELEKATNKLSGDKKEQQKEKVEGLVDALERYTELVNSSIPEMVENWADLTNQIKEAQRTQLEYVTDIQEQITDALTEELQKRTDAVKSELEKQRDLYNQQFEDENWEDSLAEENRKLDELKQQIASISRDTSLAGQLKLEQLMADYEAQLDAINQMIRDKEKENGNLAFDEAIENLDKELENALNPQNLAQMVNQALTQGFIDLDGEIISTENLLTQMLETSGEAFTALGQTLRAELIDGLEVAKKLASELGSSINGIGFTTNSRSALSVASANNQLNSRMVSGLDAVKTVGRQMEQIVNVTFDKLLNIEGNFDSTILSDVEVMLDNAKNEITYTISKALTTT